MKKIAFIYFLIIVLILSSCSTKNNSNDNINTDDENKQEEDIILTYDSYNLNAYMTPFWNTKIVYNETLMFVGKDDKAPLMFLAEEIISVRSYDLETEYVLGIDYTIEDNCLVLTENTSMPYFNTDEYYPLVPVTGSAFGCTRSDHNFILFGEGDTFCKNQIAVTYKHNERWTMEKPLSQSEKFSKTIQKLKTGENVNIVFYGDSITTGANSSKTINVAPYAENWTEMVTNYLKQTYKTENINYTNTAVGGTKTTWGIENVESRVNDYNPDLVILGFGMNDPDLTAETYQSQIQSIIDAIIVKNAECEIMLVAPMLPNSEVAGFYGNQYSFESALENITMLYDNIGLAKVTSMHQIILGRKRHYDMTGNNVNHPNDFLARIYAQTIMKSLIGEEYSK
jgi:hypothetical protein